MQNRARLAAEGIAIPGPGQYRQQLRKLAHEMRDQPTDAATQEALLDALLDDDNARRVVFSWENFLAMPGWVVGQGRLYPAAAERITLMRRLFPTARVSVFLALRNPAGLLPALARQDTGGTLEREAQTLDPTALHWSDLIARLTEAAPDVPVTLWCDEDTPLLWPQILRAVSNHDPARDLDGWLNWYQDLVTPKGFDTLRRWFAAHPASDDLLRRKTLSALVARFARPEEVELDARLPGWSDQTIDQFTAAYDADLDVIAAMPGVTLLEP